MPTMHVQHLSLLVRLSIWSLAHAFVRAMKPGFIGAPAIKTPPLAGAGFETTAKSSEGKLQKTCPSHQPTSNDRYTIHQSGIAQSSHHTHRIVQLHLNIHRGITLEHGQPVRNVRV